MNQIDRYCLCGNEPVDKTGIDGTGELGPKCAELVKGPLFKSYAVYQMIREGYRQCCGGISRFDSTSDDKVEFNFHGEYWHGSYGDEPMVVEVEFGVSLLRDHAETYYIYDSDKASFSESQVYGEPIPYSSPTFMEDLDAQLDRAPEAAWNADILSCNVCGDHYYTPNGSCCDEDGP